MKNKISTKLIVCLIILVFGALSAPKAFAFKAVFPDDKSLQPIPVGVHANISGSINSTGNPADEVLTDNGEEVSTPEGDLSATETSGMDKVADEESSPHYIIWSLTILLIMIILFFTYRRIRAK